MTKLLLVAGTIAAFTSFETIVQAQGPPAGVPPAGPAVTVVNTPANPVPVTGSLSGTVTITNTPNVLVTNQVTVSDADNAGRHSVTIHVSTSSTSGSGFQFWQKNNVYTVPDGKRLVIEDLDAQAFITPAANTGAFRGELSIYNGTSSISHPIGSTSIPVQCSLTQTCFSLSRLSRVYADEGNILSVNFSANVTLAGGFHAAEGTINGYLVDLP